ncbi:MAG: glycosyltransferase [Anaerolineae bacterium]|nr:glycosyltransferase [Anaerolineae bacterium]
MRILWTSPHCRPDWMDRLGQESQGGQTVVMNQLSHALTRADPVLWVDIFTRFQADDPYSDPPIQFLDGDPRVRIIRLPCGPEDNYLRKEFLYGAPIAEFADYIVALARREGARYDLLHGHYADGWETVTLLKERLSNHPPVLLTTHSLGRRKLADALERKEGSRERLEQRYNFQARIASEERSLSRAERVLPLSTPEAEFLQAHYDAVSPHDLRLNIVPNGIDPQAFPLPAPDVRAATRAELGVGAEDFLLLVPSRVDPRKGQETLLRALGTVREQVARQPFRLLFLAWPDLPTAYATRLERVIGEVGIDERVLKHPPVPHSRMPAFFAAADGVVLPSQEYFSIAMLEAMLMERPLIASVHSSGRDVIEDGEHGWLVDHNDLAALGAAVVRLLEMPASARQRVGRQARERVLGFYTWDQIAGRLLGIYYPLAR